MPHDSTEKFSSDLRIDALGDEVKRLRAFRHDDKNGMQALTLGMAEIKLNLAQQDKLLGRLDATMNGNGKPGLMTRVDRIEQWVAANKWFMRAMAAAVLGAIAAAIAGLIFHIR